MLKKHLLYTFLLVMMLIPTSVHAEVGGESYQGGITINLIEEESYKTDVNVVFQPMNSDDDYLEYTYTIHPYDDFSLTDIIPYGDYYVYVNTGGFNGPTYATSDKDEIHISKDNQADVINVMCGTKDYLTNYRCALYERDDYGNCVFKGYYSDSEMIEIVKDKVSDQAKNALKEKDEGPKKKEAETLNELYEDTEAGNARTYTAKEIISDKNKLHDVITYSILPSLKCVFIAIVIIAIYIFIKKKRKKDDDK